VIPAAILQSWCSRRHHKWQLLCRIQSIRTCWTYTAQALIKNPLCLKVLNEQNKKEEPPLF